MQFAEFTPNVEIKMDGRGNYYQVVDGKKQIISPAVAVQVFEWRDDGLPDNEILDWLRVT